jgi:hypothetical protein
MDQGCEACMAKISELLAERDALKADDTRLRAEVAIHLNDIAELCGCKHWDYPGQVVRDVKLVVTQLAELRELNEKLSLQAKTQDNVIQRLMIEHREYDTRFRMELIAQITAWRRKARELDGYDVGMHEVRACADELELLLAKVRP